MKSKTKILLGSVGAVAFTCVIAGSAIVSAQSTTSTSFMDRVAQLAGVDPQKLKDSFKQATKEEVDAKVKDGKLTEDQANKIKEKIEDENFSQFPRGIMGHNGFGKPPMTPQLDKIAEYLGTDEIALKNSFREGKTLAQIAEEKGKTKEDLRSFLSTQFDESLKTAVTDGKLTQEQSEKISEKKDEIITRMLEGKPGMKNLRGEIGKQ